MFKIITIWFFKFDLVPEAVPGPSNVPRRIPAVEGTGELFQYHHYLYQHITSDPLCFLSLMVE